MKTFYLFLSALLLFLTFPHAASSEAPLWLNIHKSEHMLYVMRGDKTVEKFPVATGRVSGNKQKSGDCRTPEGAFSVEQIQNASGWSHDFHDGKGVIAGAYGPWFIRLKTGWKGIGIHGTHDPSSIGHDVTEGCIRLLNKDVDRLKKEYVTVGMKVVIIK